MKRKVNREAVIAIFLALLVIFAAVSVAYKAKKYSITKDISEIRSEAEALYAAGDAEGAISKMEAYCAYTVTDIEAAALLGDWYMAEGNEEKALECYRSAAKNKKTDADALKTLTVKNTSDIVTESIVGARLEISPDVRMTKDMTLKITSRNLMPQATENGRIEGTDRELIDEEQYLTTDWFDVDPSGGYLTISGGFNCAVWQFNDAYGDIIAGAASGNRYRVKDDYSVKNYQMSRVSIPEDAAQCRVTYFDFMRENSSADNSEPVSIVFGRLPGESREAVICSYDVPDLKEGEKIILENSSWRMVDADGNETYLDWTVPKIEKGSYVSIGGTLPGKVDFTGSKTADYKKDGIYTVRFDLDKPYAVGERLDDAAGLGFNAASGGIFLTVGENDFDNIYPWSEMKLCCIKDGSIVYEGEYGYSSRGESGDVFVEIPKFYSRRESDGHYETISISGAPQPGFETDEAFVTEDGECDAIYIAAYLSSVDENGCARSVSGDTPHLMESAEEIARYAEKNGEGYFEMDYAALFALQKLFLVETAMRNSQYLYMGECALTVADTDGIYSTALKSAKNTNMITISKENTFLSGDGIIIFSDSNLEMSVKDAVSDVRTVETVIDNADRTRSVYFSGEPMNIKEGDSSIAHVAVKNGNTGGSGYHTSTDSTARGTTAFKYRNIENIWGDAFVYVSGVNVKSGRITVEKRNGDTAVLSYSLPRSVHDAEGNINYNNSIVKKMGFDRSNPSIMLPAASGGGATVSTYYGDAVLSERGDEEKVLYYGGSWYMQELTGLFCYSALWGKDEVRLEAAGRMMRYGQMSAAN